MTVTDWNLLRTLIAVSDAGSLTGAARALKTTQPTVGRHIRELEAMVGETLFDRMPAGMLPTTKAVELLHRLDPMRQGAAAFTSALKSTARRVSGTVRVTASQSFASIVLPEVLARLLAQEPGLQIELVVSDDVKNLLLREADIAIRFFRPEQPELIAASLGEAEMGVFADTSYLEEHGVPVRIAEVCGRLVGDDDMTRALALCSAAGFEIRREDFRFRSDSDSARLTAIEQGIGPGALWHYVARRRPALKRVLPQLVLHRAPLWLCAHDDLRRSARLRRVFEFLASALREEFGHPCEPRAVPIAKALALPT